MIGEKRINKQELSAIEIEANDIVSNYKIDCIFEDGYYFGNCSEHPMVFGDGKTIDECIKDTREALFGVVVLILEEKRE